MLLVVTSVRLPSRYSGSVPLGIFVGYLATPGSTHMRITLNYGEVVDHFFGSKEDVSQDLWPTNSLKNDQCNRTDWVLDSFGSLKYHKMNVLYFLKPCVGCFVNWQVYQCLPAGLTFPRGSLFLPAHPMAPIVSFLLCHRFHLKSDSKRCGDGTNGYQKWRASERAPLL